MKKSPSRNMPWFLVEDYQRGKGWVGPEQCEPRARAYWELLEHAQILFFREPPFDLPAADQQFLLEQQWSEMRMHKNVSYRRGEDLLRGVSGNRETVSRVHS